MQAPYDIPVGGELQISMSITVNIDTILFLSATWSCFGVMCLWALQGSGSIPEHENGSVYILSLSPSVRQHGHPVAPHSVQESGPQWSNSNAGHPGTEWGVLYASLQTLAQSVPLCSLPHECLALYHFSAPQTDCWHILFYFSWSNSVSAVCSHHFWPLLLCTFSWNPWMHHLLAYHGEFLSGLPVTVQITKRMSLTCYLRLNLE